MEEKLQDILNATLKNGKIIDTVDNFSVSTAAISSTNCVLIFLTITIIAIIVNRISSIDNILKGIATHTHYSHRTPYTYCTSLLDTCEDDSTAKTDNATQIKIDKIDSEVKALKDELHSVREDILHTIRAMPPVMGEDFASAASRFEFRQEQEEGLRIRKTDKDE
jgi:hypothetical protein